MYLHTDITPAVVREASATGEVYGIKSYPAGVTTNSGSGVVDYEVFYPVFEEMERCGIVLNRVKLAIVGGSGVMCSSRGGSSRSRLELLVFS